MSKILVLGGSHSDVPLIKASLLYGLEVFTTGNQPEHPGHMISRKYIQGDYSKKEQILDIAKSLEIDYVVPGANDFAMTAAAYIAEKLHLPGYDSFEVTTMIHRKDLFKSFATTIDMPVCRNVSIDTENEISIIDQIKGLKFPIIIKPVDLTGGKGISRVDYPGQLDLAISEAKKLSYHKIVIAEEWFEGNLHSYSTIIENGEIIFEYFDTEYCLYQQYLVSTSLSTCNLPNEAKRALREATLLMVKKLKLTDGVLHGQFLANGQDIRIIEFTRRMSGDLYSKVIQKVCGFRHEDIFIASAMNQSLFNIIKTNSYNYTHPYVSRHCITAEKSGVLKNIKVSEKMRNTIQSINMIMPIGSVVKADGRSKVAVIITQFNNEKEMFSYKNKCKEDFYCEVN